MEKVIPKIVENEDLIGLNKNGRDCEVCHESMHEHEWAALDPNGFVVFCSNLEYKGVDPLEVITEEYYKNDEDTPDLFNYGITANPDRVMALATRRSERDLEAYGDLEKVEIYARRNVVFFGPKVRSVKLGDWTKDV